MLLTRDVTWATVDEEPFDIALTDHGRTVTARVVVDERRLQHDRPLLQRSRQSQAPDARPLDHAHCRVADCWRPPAAHSRRSDLAPAARSLHLRRLQPRARESRLQSSAWQLARGRHWTVLRGLCGLGLRRYPSGTGASREWWSHSRQQREPAGFRRQAPRVRASLAGRDSS